MLTLISWWCSRVFDWFTDSLHAWFCITVGRFAETATNLRQQDVEIIAPKICKQPDRYGDKFDKKVMICAGDPESGKEACCGDGGGPLQCLNSDGRWSLAGLISWGAKRCGTAKKPGVYTNVAAMLDWIKSHFPGICIHIVCMTSVGLWYK